MSYTTPVVVHRPACPIVGLSIVTKLKETQEQGTFKQMYENMVARSAEIKKVSARRSTWFSFIRWTVSSTRRFHRP